jgi:hypothetical protein
LPTEFGRLTAIGDAGIDPASEVRREEDHAPFARDAVSLLMASRTQTKG